MITTINYTPEVTEENILNVLKKDGIVILTDLFDNEILGKIESEFDRLFEERKDDIDVLDKEGCSMDERIFNAQAMSPDINKYFTVNPLLCNIAHKYTGINSPYKKTMINKVSYQEGAVINSGGGWHRDAHDIQFKSIMYLTDVDKTNGNFQWLTNSSRKYVGYPTPRTQSYDTRFSDSVVDQLIKDNDSCELVDVVGKKGTLIIADTTYIHRGAIIEAGERKAITQYYR